MDQPTDEDSVIENFGALTFNYREFVCGWGAAFVNISATFPMNKVSFIAENDY